MGGKKNAAGRRIKGIMKRDWCTRKEFKGRLKRSGQRDRQRPLLKDLSLVYCEDDGKPLKDAKL